MPSHNAPQTTSRPLFSYLLRVIEERTVHVAQVYELHDIASGKRRRFATLAALERHLAYLARQGRAR